jgi:hypothetical protein
MAMDTHTTVKELLGVVFSVQPVLRLYSEHKRDKLVSWGNELAVRQSPVGKNVNMKDEEYAFLGAITLQWLMKTN